MDFFSLLPSNIDIHITKVGLLSRLLMDLRLLVSLVIDFWKGNYREVPAASIAAVCLAVLYIVLPVDLIPDWIIGPGQLDDAAVLLLCLFYLEKDLHKYRDWKANRNEDRPV